MRRSVISLIALKRSYRDVAFENRVEIECDIRVTGLCWFFGERIAPQLPVERVEMRIMKRTALPRDLDAAYSAHRNVYVQAQTSVRSFLEYGTGQISNKPGALLETDLLLLVDGL